MSYHAVYITYLHLLPWALWQLAPSQEACSTIRYSKVLFTKQNLTHSKEEVYIIYQTYFFFLKVNLFSFYLKERERERFHLLNHSPNACSFRGWASLSPRLRTQSASRRWVAGTQGLEPSFADSRVHENQKLEWRVESGLKLHDSNMD